MPAKSQRFSSSQLNTSSLDFNDDDYDKFSADAVFFVLVQERKRIPVKKADIMKVRICFLDSSHNFFDLLLLEPSDILEEKIYSNLHLAHQFDRKGEGGAGQGDDGLHL